MARRYRDASKPDRDPRDQWVVGPLEDHPPAVNGPAIAIVAIGGSGAFGQIRDAMPFLGADRLSVALPSRAFRIVGRGLAAALTGLSPRSTTSLERATSTKW